MDIPCCQNVEFQPGNGQKFKKRVNAGLLKMCLGFPTLCPGLKMCLGFPTLCPGFPKMCLGFTKCVSVS